MNIIKKLYLKALHPNQYRKIKHEAGVAKAEAEFFNQLQVLGSGELHFPKKESYTVKHSGHSGDIIYSLPTALAMGKEFGSGNIDFLIGVNVPLPYKSTDIHPNGDVFIPQNVFDMFRPLLEIQPGIKSVGVYDQQPVDCDLDLFRQYPMQHDKSDIAKWYSYIYPVNIDLSEPWLKVEPNSVSNNSIVLARSTRYNCRNIDYSFLSQYPSVVFVGLEDEFSRMRKTVRNLKWLATKDFKQLAEVIAGARLFIGNQSFPFSLAEAIKVPRLLEVYPMVPNVNPTGGLNAIFTMQNRLEYLTRLFWEKTA